MNMADKGQAPLKCVFDRLVRMRQPVFVWRKYYRFWKKPERGSREISLFYAAENSGQRARQAGAGLRRVPSVRSMK